MNAADDKIIVKDYFNSTGFDRWKRIYGDGDVNKVQLDIRNGHQQTVDKVLHWLKADGNLTEVSICDAGCGASLSCCKYRLFLEKHRNLARHRQTGF